MTNDSPSIGSTKTLNIGLLWHSLRSGNLGVGALTIANMAIAREEAERVGAKANFIIFGMREIGPENALSKATDTRVIDRRYLLSKDGYRTAMSEVDCMLDIGAGDSFAEIYGARRFFFLWMSKLLAIRAGLPLILAPQTIGPFTRTPYRQLARYVMDRSDAVVSRDHLSFEAMKTLAPSAKSLMAVDVAFLLPFESRASLRDGERLRVGLNVSGLLFNQAEAGRNSFGLSYDYAAYSRALLRDLCARTDVEVNLIAHATSATDPSDDDGALADRLAKEFPAAIRVPNFAGPSEAKSFISGLDFLIAARMHACVAAFSSGTPVLPVAYSRKFDGLFGSLGYDWSLPVNELSLADAVTKTLTTLDRREEMSWDEADGMKKVAERMEPYRRQLRETFQAALAHAQ